MGKTNNFIINVLKNIFDKNNNTLKVTQSGSNVPAVETLIFPATQIRDTTAHKEQFDPSLYKRVVYVARNTTDQPIDLLIYRPVDGGSQLPHVWNGTSWDRDDTITIPAAPTGSHFLMLNTRFDWLGEVQSDLLEFRATAQVAPISGGFELFAWGVLN